MAFEEKTRSVPAGEQAPAPELMRQLVGTMVQETIRAEFGCWQQRFGYRLGRRGEGVRG